MVIETARVLGRRRRALIMKSDERYKIAIEKLYSLVLPVATARDKYGSSWSLNERYLRLSQLDQDTLAQLPIIHVAGTKGKGTTCAMLERILRECGYRTGLFTSPHLCDVRERIRINGAKIDRDLFAQETLWLHARFEAASQSEGHPMPLFFPFLTFLALRLFAVHELDVVILEVGIGGRFDSTNVIPAPVLCGVTSLAFDHTDLLGSTLREIAFQKAGIFKKGAIAYSLPQYKEAMEVLEHEAAEKQISLINVGHAAPYRNFSEIKNQSVHKGVQSLNATLAIHLAKAFEELSWKRPMRQALRQNHSAYAQRMHHLKDLYLLPEEYLKALSAFEWPGRQQILKDLDLIPAKGNPNLTFYLDGAHTVESLAACLNWFGAETKQLRDPVRLLLFNCHQNKDMSELLKSVLLGMESGGINFQHVLFAPSLNQIRIPDHNFQHQKAELTTWQKLLEHSSLERAPPLGEISQMSDFLDIRGLKSSSSTVSADICPSVLGALGWVRSFARQHRKFDIRMLVTGSLYLVGDALKFLGRAPK